MEILWWKVISIFVMMLLVWFGGFLPTQLHALAEDKRQFALGLGNAFSGGVFLCVGLVHLLPEAAEQIEHLNYKFNETMPIAYVIAMGGFLLIFWIEKILLSSSDPEEHRAIAAIQSKAAAKDMAVDVIVIPRQIIPHYHERKRARTLTLSGSSTSSVAESSSLLRSRPFEDEIDSKSRSQPIVTVRDMPFTVNEAAQFDKKTWKMMEKQFKKQEKVAHEHEHKKLVAETADGHHHHHINVSTSYPLVPYILALVLSVHSVIEGMALGIGTNAEQTVILIIALASHKWIEAFAFSTSFVKEGVPVRRWIGILLMYSLMTPLGITGGIFLSDYLSGDNAILAEAIMESLAAGSFLYVSLVDIICEEFNEPGPRRKRYPLFASMLLGIALIIGVLFWNEL
ncbi:metal cation transporter, ZIP subfamily protein [Acanthamoeba castellanii str. Neff]|uniref:Metal cation transporter, ZIP subfamily protein n=1 Tax=Acanthamoeba castellanii (strain ATCC 30010 / Neff) TaxID=1257118 RepID=L8H1A3_ACACF|nr:metal cation transporter, ZIP subfamily protein [Acanthamoeba castellanii str. Neff]ELR18131.1 metal cation transporter, ZIP subfamily protein [Acanthamoeba castellanii str. Neff]